MLSKNLKLLIIAGTTSTVLGSSVIVVSNVNANSLKSAADPAESYSVTFDVNSTLGNISTADHEYDYAYANSGLGNKYGVILQTDRVVYDIYYNVPREEGDLLTMQGSSKYIYFSYGNFSSSATYTEANFAGYIKKVSVNCYYTNSVEQSFYLRLLHSNDGTWSESDSSKRLSYKPTKDTPTTLEYDFEAYSRTANQFRLTSTNGTVKIHILSITIEYNC